MQASSVSYKRSKTLPHRLTVAALSTAVLLVASAPSFANATPKEVAAQGVRDFGFKMFKSVYDQKQTEPVAISPMSISEALSMTSLGAEADTLKEFESLFINSKHRAEGADAQTVADGIKEIRDELVDYASKSNGAFEYTGANALWGNTNPEWKFEFRRQFLKDARSKFGAVLEEQDFADGATLTNINDWVSKSTKGKIKDLLRNLNPDSVAVLLNAIYAKGKFMNHFHSLEEGKYTNALGATQNVTYMNQQERAEIYQDNKLQAVSLRVGENNFRAAPSQIALDIIVARDKKLDTLMKELTADSYAKLTKGFKGSEVELSITAGKVEQKEPLKLTGVLQAKPFLLARAFNEKLAQFDLLGTTVQDANLYISDVVTKTFYEVTPFGFEAAAATAVTVAAATSAPVSVPVFKVDGPSVHIVRHIPTGTPLFLSVYDSPALYNEARIVGLVEEGHKSDRFLQAKVAGGTIYAQTDFNTGKSQIVLADEQTGKVLKVLKNL